MDRREERNKNSRPLRAVEGERLRVLLGLLGRRVRVRVRDPGRFARPRRSSHVVYIEQERGRRDGKGVAILSCVC